MKQAALVLSLILISFYSYSAQFDKTSRNFYCSGNYFKNQKIKTSLRGVITTKTTVKNIFFSLNGKTAFEGKKLVAIPYENPLREHYTEMRLEDNSAIVFDKFLLGFESIKLFMPNNLIIPDMFKIFLVGQGPSGESLNSLICSVL